MKGEIKNLKELTVQAVRVLEERYLKRDEKGVVVETPEEMFWRVAEYIARAESNYCNHCRYVSLNGQDDTHYKDCWECLDKTEAFHDIMSNLDFLPNSPCLANAGKNNMSLSACYVLPVEDSLEGIFESVKNAALIHQTGGGTGFSFSRLRPAGSLVSTTGHVASGPVSFMRVFDAATAAIKQGGMRRGANMGVLHCDHPDIMEFIHCKDDGGSITNFNISVLITEEFMACLEECDDGNHIALWPDGRRCACGLWREIAESAHRTGDPGVIFIDRINEGRANPIKGYTIFATNPCGEQPLYDYDSCNLGSINLGNFVIPRHDGRRESTEDSIAWERLKEVVHTAVRFLDNVIDMNQYVIPEIDKVTKDIRRIGLGVMGWADMLIQLEIPYASEEAVELGREISRFIGSNADEASRGLSLERGPFPLFNQSIYAGGEPLRNSTRTTIAPTGTISLIAGCSSGIEPLFALEVEHHGLEGKLKGQRITNPFVEEFVQRVGYAAVNHPVLKTAHEIAPSWHVAHQAAWQEGVDNAVSKTINLPEEAMIEDIDAIYREAYGAGCKGITVYRDNCRKEQVLNVRSEGVGKEILDVEGDGVGRRDNGPSSREDEGVRLELPCKGGFTARLRPTVLDSRTFRQPTPFGNMYVTLGEDEGEPYEVFITIGKAGSDIQAMAEGLGRVVSKWLQATEVVDRVMVLDTVQLQLEGIGGSSSSGFGKDKVRSIPDAVAKVIGRYLDKKEEDMMPPGLEAEEVVYAPSTKNTGDLCLDCGGFSVYYGGGCPTCQACGWSKC